MNAHIQKWGNSLAVRIPMSYAKNIHLHKGSEVDLVLAKGKIEIRPKDSGKKQSLESMIKKINNQNLHREVDWGDSGKEIF